jgi:hypothetical protein
VPVRAIHAVRRALIVLHVFLGVSAVGAGTLFALDPSGAGLGMTVDLLEGGPFPDYLVPGLFLAIVIGGANLASAVLLWRRHLLASRASLATGLLLLAWTVVQLSIIGFTEWTQGIWVVMFSVVTVLALVLVRGERAGSAASPAE